MISRHHVPPRAPVLCLPGLLRALSTWYQLDDLYGAGPVVSRVCEGIRGGV